MRFVGTETDRGDGPGRTATQGMTASDTTRESGQEGDAQFPYFVSDDGVRLAGVSAEVFLEPDEAAVEVRTMDTLVDVKLRNDVLRLRTWLSAEEARQLARRLEEAAGEIEGDS